MSSTNRGAPKVENEHFITQDWVVRAILPALGRPMLALDLGCGAGAIGTVLREAFGEALDLHGIEIDPGRAHAAKDLIASVHPSFDPCRVYDDVKCEDVLALDPARVGTDYDLVIANPPFSLAVSFAEIAFRHVRPGGIVAFLQREGWLSCKERLAWKRAHPVDRHTLDRRPSFAKVVRPCSLCDGAGTMEPTLGGSLRVPCKRCKGKGSTTTSNDSCAYAWFVWVPGIPWFTGGRSFDLECEPAERSSRPKRRRKEVVHAAEG